MIYVALYETEGDFYLLDAFLACNWKDYLKNVG
jgi:hypothetical protein